MLFIVSIFILLINLSNAYFHQEYNLILNHETIKIKKHNKRWFRIYIHTNDTLIVKYRRDLNNGINRRRRSIDPNKSRIIRYVEDDDKLNNIKLQCDTICKVYVSIKKRSDSYYTNLTLIVIGCIFGIPICCFISCCICPSICDNLNTNIQTNKILKRKKQQNKFYKQFYNIFLIEKVKEKYLAKEIYKYANLDKYIIENV